MTDHLRPEPADDHEPLDLMAVGADDRLLDDLGQDIFGESDHDDPAERALAVWRSSLLPHDLPAPPAAPVVERVVRRRALPMVAAAAAIVALLLGTAAIGSRAAGPDDMLWPLTKLLWPDRIESVAAAENAVIALDLARTALDQGEPPQASVVLTAAAHDISRVQPRDGRAELDADYEQLWTELEEVMASASFPSSQLTPTPRPSDPTTGSTASSTTAPNLPSGTTGSTRPPTSGTGSSAPAPPPVTTTPPSTSSTTTSTSTSSTTEVTTETPPSTTPTVPDPPTESSSPTSSVTESVPEVPVEESPAALPFQQRILEPGADVPSASSPELGEN